VGWELLCLGGHLPPGLRGEWRDGARGTGALQHGGGGQVVWGCVGEDCEELRRTAVVTGSWGEIGLETENRRRSRKSLKNAVTHGYSQHAV